MVTVPEFLWLSKDSWPEQQNEETPDSELEIKNERTTCVTGLKIAISPVSYELLNRFSDWSKLLSSVTWLCKYKVSIQNGKRLEWKRLTMEDLALAKRTIIVLQQTICFMDDARNGGVAKGTPDSL